jgi:2',3'-cyclic-nucleotide 2'-phosphodiesterase (5'-nucleotidase family)
MKIKNLLFGFFLLAISCSPKSTLDLQQETLFVVEVDERNERIDQRVKEEDPSINELIAPYKEELDKTMGEVIASTPFELVKSRPNGSLNNWVADLVLELTNANYDRKIDFAIQNYGGVRVSSIGQGDILIRTIYELMPFDNKVSILELDGKVVDQLFSTIAEQGGWPISKEVKLYLTAENTYDRATIQGREIDPDRKYLVSMPDYIANGNGGCDFLKDQDREDLELLIRDGMIQFLKSDQEDGKLQATLEKRIINE